MRTQTRAVTIETRNSFLALAKKLTSLKSSNFSPISFLHDDHDLNELDIELDIDFEVLLTF